MNENNYTQDIEIYLENLRTNCVLLSSVHKKRYFELKGLLPLFKIPNIIISSCCSVISVGISSWLNQQYISSITCILSLLSAIITSIELYLGIEKGMIEEESISRCYYLLGTSIFKNLSLSRENRKIEAHDFMSETYGEYNKLIERSAFVKKHIEDRLMPLPSGLMSCSSSTISLEIN